jgi:cytochrome b6-f complex iron-sulfur subunit
VAVDAHIGARRCIVDKGKVPRRDFIRLGAAAGLGAVGSSVLTACGSGAGGGAAQEGGGKEPKKKEERASGEPSTTSPTVKEGEPIVEAGFVPAGFAFAFEVAETGKPAFLVHLPDDRWAAYEAACTHAGCEVAYQLESRKLGCPCHGSVFDPARGGAVVQGPAKSPLGKMAVRVREGKVLRA